MRVRVIVITLLLWPSLALACLREPEIFLKSKSCEIRYRRELDTEVSRWADIVKQKEAECRFSEEEMAWLVQNEELIQDKTILEQDEPDYHADAAEAQRIEADRKSILNFWRWKEIDREKCGAKKITARWGRWTVVYWAAGHWNDELSRCDIPPPTECG